MRIDNKATRLLMVAVAGVGLVACQPEPDVAGQAASDRKDPANSMNQAPRQGFTGPATSTTPSAGSATGTGQSGEAGTSGSSSSSGSLDNSATGSSGSSGTTVDPAMKQPGQEKSTQ